MEEHRSPRAVIEIRDDESDPDAAIFTAHNIRPQSRAISSNCVHAQSGDLDVITTSAGRYAIPTISLIDRISIDPRRALLEESVR